MGHFVWFTPYANLKHGTNSVAYMKALPVSRGTRSQRSNVGYKIYIDPLQPLRISRLIQAVVITLCIEKDMGYGLSLNVANNSCQMEDEEDRNSFQINCLPQVVFLSILSYLDVQDLGRASCVSKHWYNSTLDPCLWRILKLQKRQKVNNEVLVRITNYGSTATVNVLDVSECQNITEEGLIMAIQHCRYLVELNVVRCPAVTDKCLAEIGQSCQNIKLLDISLCHITDSGVKELCEGCTKLESLTMDQCRSLTCISLLSVAQNCPKLRCISVEYNNKFQDAGVCELVQRCPLLEKVHLNSCGITSQTALYISQYCRNISVLDLRYCSSLTDDVVKQIVVGCAYLRVLNLSLCFHVTDTSVEQIISKCVALRGLYLVHCKISDNGLEAFSRYVCNLERLDISWCQEVTDQGVRTVLQGCPYLKHLGLVRCDQVREQTVVQLNEQYPHVFLSTVITEMNRMCERAQLQNQTWQVSPGVQKALQRSKDQA